MSISCLPTDKRERQARRDARSLSSGLTRWARVQVSGQFDPFAHRPRARCTVGALQAEAADHDISLRSYDQGRFEREVGAGIADIVERIKG